MACYAMWFVVGRSHSVIWLAFAKVKQTPVLLKKCNMCYLWRQGRVCRPLFVVEQNRLCVRKKHINDLHDPNYGWTNLMQQVSEMRAREKRERGGRFLSACFFCLFF